MQQLVDKARELLSSGAADCVIGYVRTPGGKIRAGFIFKPEDASGLVWDEACKQNLAVYLNKKEVRALGKVALFASPHALKSVLVLAGENQIEEGQFIILAQENNSIRQFEKFAEIETHLAVQSTTNGKQTSELLDRVLAMNPEERWDFWVAEFSKCIKCYACRSVCPMCYCTQCITDCNKPQWIPLSSNGMGNFEWHVTRAMHLAGRCIECGACTEACPQDIPLNLLTKKLNNDIREHFGQAAGLSSKSEYVLSNYKPDDKENFIR